LIEALVRTPSLQVRAWIVTESMTSDELRNILLDLRGGNIRDVIVSSSNQIMLAAILDAVRISSTETLQILYIIIWFGCNLVRSSQHFSTNG